MRIAFNPAKDAINLAKHGISLAAATRIEWDTLYAVPDTRQTYGEERMIGIGYIGLRLFVVVYVDRDDRRRIISLRKANRREENRYAKA
ncbi:BrnT family toxin [Herbaspirillum sp.]|uniref:BrnT family toxin n=1 Tax=Herbaspirillum sp. TaxID=1890675 RepID=UPI001B123455|nr:BrnT family toxin [Herbaspirillum sp.]MBO9535326.1 BrnT family toxin [Herbaspirillum sp.]